jgi:hypothetical protein
MMTWFRNKVNEAGDENYQTLISDTLREYIGQQQEPLEKVVRRVLREELKRIA